jgi:hypothetical protein
MPLNLWYAMSPFFTSCALNQDFKKRYFTMANNASHNLVLKKLIG